MYRTLIIGLEKEKYNNLCNDNIKIYHYLEDAPTLYDYEVILLFSEGLKYPALSTMKKSEFDIFFNNNGILIIFPSAPIPPDIIAGEFKNMIFTSGEVIIPNNKHMLSRIFSKFSCVWMWHGVGSTPDDFVIARNSINCEVATEINLSDGKIFLFPLIKNIDQLPDYILEIIDLIEAYMGHSGSSRPDWSEHYNYEYELALKDEEKRIADQLKEIDLIKSTLYTYGNPLSRRVCKLLGNIGFKAEWTEPKAKHDIEVDFNGTIGIVEVRGLKGPANNDDIRQLLDHYLDYLGKHNSNGIKGIFIVNHFRETDPNSRGLPFTDGAIKIAKSQGFCLITTLDLFEIYNAHLNGKLNLDDLRNQIINSKGLLQQPKDHAEIPLEAR